MASRRKKLPLSASEDAALRHLYRLMRIPSDQYPRRPDALRAFIETFNEAVAGSYQDADVLHYIMTTRKAGDWVTFDGDYLPLKDVCDDFFLESEWSSLIEIFVATGKGVDAYLFDEILGSHLELEFAKLTGRAESSNILISALMALRKAGRLPTIGRDGDDTDDDIGFRDIGEVG